MSRLMRLSRFSQPKTQQGVTLVEVLIVFFVLSVGLLGMAALQMRSIQYNQSAYIRSQADVAAYDILDRMRMNRTVATANGYDVLMGANNASTATGGTLAVADLTAWKTFLANTLPSGDGSVACASATCTITIQWLDRVVPASGGSAQTVSTTVVAQL